MASGPREVERRRVAETAARDEGAADERAAGEARWPWREASAGRLWQGLLFGVVFGFLLQKGGVAKFDILIGVLLLETFVVVKVMVSAIVVGMVGVYLAERAGGVERQVKPTVWGVNVVGGLVFGAGFALLAYCPGTNAAALGQGNWDALAGVAGLMLGSYLFALTAGAVGRTIGRWGRWGEVTLPGMLKVGQGPFVAGAVVVLVGGLVLLEVYV